MLKINFTRDRSKYVLILNSYTKSTPKIILTHNDSYTVLFWHKMIPTQSDSDTFWLWHNLFLTPFLLFWRKTILTQNNSDTEQFWHRTILTQNNSDTKQFWHRKIMIPNNSDTKIPPREIRIYLRKAEEELDRSSIN